MTAVLNTSHDPVDRLAEDFLARYRQGDRPSISEYAMQFPDVADQVADVIQVLLLMENLGEEQANEKENVTGVMPDHLGEYRIVREIGRGGMGVVYEAVQAELGRQVALKVLPSAAFFKPLHLERFRREAKAAARLHHTNIVPVFSVGDQDGIYFYAMQYIQGQGLDAVLKDVRLQRTNSDVKDTLRDAQAPTHHSSMSGYGNRNGYARTVVRIARQIAEALDHAHAQGILHRDIKPSNILLDQAGTAWLSDFGLAQIETSEHLTGTGDIVGTLRYMAPERFKRPGDARSDIYSLGITLYELLTLQPAFQESDRAKLIHQILKEEPPGLRRIDSALPRDLETIVLKAISKEPEHRYQTSQELAEDLNRFLTDLPVAARRLRWWERSWRWMQRNGALSITAALAFAALLVGLATTYWQWQRAEGEAEAKEVKRQEAEGNARTAQQQRGRAQAYAERSQEMLDKILGEILAFPQRLTRDEARQRLMTSALQLHQDFMTRVSDDEISPLETAQLALRASELHSHLQDREKAEAALDMVRKLLDSKLVDDEQSEKVRSLRARYWLVFGWHLTRLPARPGEADTAIRNALLAYAALRADYPQEPLYTFGYCNAASILAQLLEDKGKLDEAATLLKTAIALTDNEITTLLNPSNLEHHSSGAASYCLRLAQLLRLAGHQQEAAEATLLAKTKIEAMAKRWPLSLSIQKQLADCYLLVSSHYFALAQEDTRQGLTTSAGHGREAFSSAQRGAGVYERLINQVPAAPEYRAGFGAIANNLADMLVMQSRLTEAESWIGKAIEQQREAVRLAPKNIHYNRYLRDHLTVLGRICLAKSDHVKASQAALQVVKMRDTNGTEGLKAARIWARCIPLVEKDQRLSDTDRPKLVQTYTNHALAGLRTAAEKGTVIYSSDIDTILKQLAALEHLPEFQQLFSQIRARAISRNSASVTKE